MDLETSTWTSPKGQTMDMRSSPRKWRKIDTHSHLETSHLLHETSPLLDRDGKVTLIECNLFFTLPQHGETETGTWYFPLTCSWDSVSSHVRLPSFWPPNPFCPQISLFYWGTNQTGSVKKEMCTWMPYVIKTSSILFSVLLLSSPFWIIVRSMFSDEWVKMVSKCLAGGHFSWKVYGQFAFLLYEMSWLFIMADGCPEMKFFCGGIGVMCFSNHWQHGQVAKTLVLRFGWCKHKLFILMVKFLWIRCIICTFVCEKMRSGGGGCSIFNKNTACFSSFPNPPHTHTCTHS